jgi:phage terminase large subunit GpA-like protein
LNFASSHKPDELAARAIKYLFLDEVDRFAQSAGIEGCPILLALKRTKTKARAAASSLSARRQVAQPPG